MDSEKPEVLDALKRAEYGPQVMKVLAAHVRSQASELSLLRSIVGDATSKSVMRREVAQGRIEAWLAERDAEKALTIAHLEALVADHERNWAEAFKDVVERRELRAQLKDAERVIEASSDVLAVRGKDYETSPLPAYMERPFSTLSDLIRAYRTAHPASPEAKEGAQ